MKTAAVLLPMQNLQFPDLAKGLVEAFTNLGWNAMWLGDKDHVKQYASQIDLVVVLTPLDYQDIHELLPNSTRVWYQQEAMPWPNRVHLKRRKDWKWDKLQKLITRYDIIWDFDKGNIENHWRYYQKRPVFHMPIGYSSMFELNKRVKQRDIALFIGSNINHKRQKHRNRACRLLLAKLKPNFGVVTGRYGDKAKQAGKNAAINLNIHQNMRVFKSLRIVALLSEATCIPYANWLFFYV